MQNTFALQETMNPKDIMTDAIHNFHPQVSKRTRLIHKLVTDSNMNCFCFVISSISSTLNIPQASINIKLLTANF